MKRVVVTGMGVVSPVGSSLKTFWTNIVAGKSGIGPITRFDASGFPCRIAAEIKDWKPEDTFTRKDVHRKDLLSLYALKAAQEAFQHSGLNQFDEDRCGIIWASGNGGIDSIENGILDYAREPSTPRFSPYFIPRTLLDTPTGEMALALGFRGINYATVSACASSNSAIMDALNYIRWGKADVILTGGSDAPITRSMIGGFGAMKALSRNNDNPSTASRPFDANRDGFVMGEGSGALLLESLDHAKARGANIICEVKGAAMNNDAFHPTATHPEGKYAARAMKLALDDAEVDFDDLDYVNMHATSTKVGDLSEINALRNIYPNGKKSLNISATKSVTGHLLGAAGAIEAIASSMSISDGIIPPTMHITELDSEFPDVFNLVRDEAQSRDVKVALSNTFGFGGHNAIIVFSKF